MSAAHTPFLQNTRQAISTRVPRRNSSTKNSFEDLTYYKYFNTQIVVSHIVHKNDGFESIQLMYIMHVNCTVSYRIFNTYKLLRFFIGGYNRVFYSKIIKNRLFAIPVDGWDRNTWMNAIARHGEIRTLFECSNFPKFEQIFQNSFEQFEHIVVVCISLTK